MLGTSEPNSPPRRWKAPHKAMDPLKLTEVLRWTTGKEGLQHTQFGSSHQFHSHVVPLVAMIFVLTWKRSKFTILLTILWSAMSRWEWIAYFSDSLTWRIDWQWLWEVLDPTTTCSGTCLQSLHLEGNFSGSAPMKSSASLIFSSCWNWNILTPFFPGRQQKHKETSGQADLFHTTCARKRTAVKQNPLMN